MKKSAKRAQDLFQKIFLINDTPHKVAAGAALGVFLGTIPGEGVLSTMLFASLLRFNRLAAIAGVLATNMWMTLVALAPAALVGGRIFKVDTQFLENEFRAMSIHGISYLFSKIIWLEMVLPLMVGFVVVAGSLAIALYGCLYFMLKSKRLKLRKLVVD